MPEVHMAIKCHPAESAAPYERDTADLANVTIVPAGADLASLVAAARLVVTVNSTVAVDAMVLGIPALVVGLPSNLSPFVEAGAMAGADTAAQIGTELTALLYDGDRRARLALASSAFMTRHAIGSDGHAARRAAEAILALATGPQRAGARS
jgi:UDP-N-acetylglucosamine 2-epimerase